MPLMLLNSPMLLAVIGLCVALLLTLNALLSREILLWLPGPRGRQWLWVLGVWLLPGLGAYLAYKHLGLDWFDPSIESTGGNATGCALLEIDSLLSPSRKEVLEVVQEEATESREFSGDAPESHSPLRELGWPGLGQTDVWDGGKQGSSRVDAPGHPS